MFPLNRLLKGAMKTKYQWGSIKKQIFHGNNSDTNLIVKLKDNVDMKENIRSSGDTPDTSCQLLYDVKERIDGRLPKF